MSRRQFVYRQDRPLNPQVVHDDVRRFQEAGIIAKTFVEVRVRLCAPRRHQTASSRSTVVTPNERYRQHTIRRQRTRLSANMQNVFAKMEATGTK